MFVSCGGSVKGRQFYLICVVFEEGRTHYFAESFVSNLSCDLVDKNRRIGSDYPVLEHIIFQNHLFRILGVVYLTKGQKNW
jgi:hypothetical protein